VLAPALIDGGLAPMAVHLFILYWGMLSFITPPVALGAFAAASISGANPVATGFEAMRLGVAIYLVPFLFVLNPALIGHGPWQGIVQAALEALLGVLLIAWSAQRHLPRLGDPGLIAAWLLGLGGLLIALPDINLQGLTLTNALGNSAGAGMMVLALSLARFRAQQAPAVGS